MEHFENVCDQLLRLQQVFADKMCHGIVSIRDELWMGKVAGHIFRDTPIAFGIDAIGKEGAQSRIGEHMEPLIRMSNDVFSDGFEQRRDGGRTYGDKAVVGLDVNVISRAVTATASWGDKSSKVFFIGLAVAHKAHVAVDAIDVFTCGKWVDVGIPLGNSPDEPIDNIFKFRSRL